MRSGSETDVLEGIQHILDQLTPSRFWCTTRKNSRASVIRKPVDLEIRFKETPHSVLVAVEVANVNTTQLVGETCRLYYDCCALKLLVLGDRNLPKDAKQQCEVLLARLYGQDRIENTPARVVLFSDDASIVLALSELLLLGLPAPIGAGAV
jgi:hypothetical protein